MDLSSPEGSSVNTQIEPELWSMKYLHCDEVISQYGRGTQMAKMDIESAYQIVPVHLDDRSLLGVQWNGQIFFNTRLPFGLRSVPKIFSTLADVLQWVIALHSWLFARSPG